MDDGAGLTPREKAFLEANPEAKFANDTPEQAPALRGVGGWLLLLAVGLLIIGPVINFALLQGELQISQAGKAPSPTSHVESMLIWGYFAFYASLSFFAGYRLLRRHVPSTIPIVIACMWLPVLVELLLVLVSGSGNSAGVAVAKSIISTSAWTAYLLLSKRVKNTFYTGRTS